MLAKISAADVTKKFMKLLISQKRLAVLPDIMPMFAEWVAAARGELPVEVFSAQPLKLPETKYISDRLKAAYGKEISIKAHTDASLLGGVIIKIGSVQLDGSLAGKLRRLKLALPAYTTVAAMAGISVLPHRNGPGALAIAAGVSIAIGVGLSTELTVLLGDAVTQPVRQLRDQEPAHHEQEEVTAEHLKTSAHRRDDQPDRPWRHTSILPAPRPQRTADSRVSGRGARSRSRR